MRSKRIAACVCVTAMIFGTVGYMPQNTLAGHFAVIANAETAGDYDYIILDDDTVMINKYNGTDIDVVIPDTIDGKPVTSIGESAFYHCTSLTAVTVPDSVTTVGKGIFRGCTELTSISLPNSITELSDDIFFNCTKLSSVKIPDSITSISDSAFSGCTGLTEITIPNSVTSIGGGAFSNCKGLTSVKMTGNVTSIGERAFLGCASLTEITLPDGVTSIGDSAFYNCNLLEKIDIPKSVDDFGYQAFYGTKYISLLKAKNKLVIINTSVIGCRSGTSNVEVTIPDGVTTISAGAFEHCAYVTGVKIPDSVTSIGCEAFCCCNALKEVRLSNNITCIEEGTFGSCYHLQSITIPDSVTSIGYEAFLNCNDLKSITIPENVTDLAISRLGYHLESEGIEWWYSPNKDFKVYCYKGTAGETYARSNGFEYELLPHRHELTAVAEKPATCEEAGNIAYWHCPTCDAYFSDEGGYDRIAAEDTVIKAGHTWSEWEVTTPATEDAEGVEIRTCEVCGETETRAIPKLEKQPELYAYTEEETEWSKDSDGAASFTIHRSTDDDKTFENFRSIEIDGEIVPSENYTAAAGSLILTFKNEYLETLAEGEHTVKVIFTDGEAVATLKIDTPSEPSFINGDADGDGAVTVTDISKVAAHVKGRISLSEDEQKRADVNGDGEMTVTDISKIAAHVKGIKSLE